ncbi:MAG: winged helix DNA-binding domain-containing protein [Chloroflexi bacterium]|nr:winged helix DNA-binding domain-containing protein [Chloroflexota bacterium]
MPPTLDDLRRHAVTRSLRLAPSLRDALHRPGFLQADPIRSPARAQDLTLRHRVPGYRAGDLERAYPDLDIEEDTFINYGYLPRDIHALMHPRPDRRPREIDTDEVSRAICDFIAARGTVHPREVDEAFRMGTGQNWFGGNTKVATQLLDRMHYRGAVRVAGRQGGTRLYAVAPDRTPPDDPHAAADRLVDVAIDTYAPLTFKGLRFVIWVMQWSALPQWNGKRKGMLDRALTRLASTRIDGTDWYWPADEDPAAAPEVPNAVRIVAPFDPVVWDRGRFEALWGWEYRFEAYVPAPKRVRGYYAMPVIWRDAVIGWANVSTTSGAMTVDVGYVTGEAPSDPAYPDALRADLADLARFLGVDDHVVVTEG